MTEERDFRNVNLEPLLISLLCVTDGKRTQGNISPKRRTVSGVQGDLIFHERFKNYWYTYGLFIWSLRVEFYPQAINNRSAKIQLVFVLYFTALLVYYTTQLRKFGRQLIINWQESKDK
jgi:hypothetical protein